jgi:hypothetical protein
MMSSGAPNQEYNTRGYGYVGRHKCPSSMVRAKGARHGQYLLNVRSRHARNLHRWSGCLQEKSVANSTQGGWPFRFTDVQIGGIAKAPV